MISMFRNLSAKTFIPLFVVALLVLCFAGCREKEQHREPEKQPVTIADIGPSHELQIAVQNLAVLGFMPAAKKEGEEEPYRSHLIVIKDQPFFIVDVKHHWFLGRSEGFDKAIEEGVLGRVKNAWAYFLMSEEQSGMIPDAIIEEWEFETQKEAFDGFKEMGGLLNSGYIKEPSYSLQHDKRVYLIYTRAQAFQNDLNKIYEMVKSHL